MRLCVCVPCFFGDLPLTEALKKVRAAGYDAAETWFLGNNDPLETRKAADELGIELVSMCTSEFRMTDPAFREKWLDGLKESAEKANILGMSRLITQVGPDTGAPREVQHEAIVTTLKLAAPVLEAHGITLMIEALNDKVDHKGYYLTSSLEAAEIIREVGHPLVKQVYDIYHMQIMEGNVITNIRQEIDTIAHLHCAGTPGRHEPWRGEIDYSNVIRAAAEAGYEGLLGLEYMPEMDPMESLENCRKIYR